MTIYHIVLPDYWETFSACEFYETESLETEGFIHCSYAEQVGPVLKRYYQAPTTVIILRIDSDKLTSRLVEEASTNNEIYPHIYGRINREAIAEIESRILV